MNTLKHALVLVLAAAVFGCAAVPGPVVEPDSPDFPDQSEVGRSCICVGLTAVDPAAYDGWAGECPGTDVDAHGLYDLCTRSGFTGELVMDSEATWTNLRARIMAYAADLSRGDLLVITMSGHGGQVEDDDGDEGDRLDETICLWDGQVRDDDVLDLIRHFPPGLRVVLISDQCHSEGNFRAIVRRIQRTVSFGRWGRIRAEALITAPRADWDGELIQYAGCREQSYSYGAEDGGTWTQSLLNRYSGGDTWRQWFDSAAAVMPANQVPVWVEYGAVTDGFRDGRSLE